MSAAQQAKYAASPKGKATIAKWIANPLNRRGKQLQQNWSRYINGRTN